jgi:3-oxoacyl-[acyl-carrier protein] reductase
MLDLSGKIALITGAAKGIGAACARAIAFNGIKALILVDLDETNGNSLAAELGGNCECIFFKIDVSNEQEVIAMFSEIQLRFGRLDILLNIAGICSTKTLFEVDVKSWDKMMDINLKGTFLIGREALKMMMENKYGRIVNMASISGQVGGVRTSPAYAASKSGIICLTKSFAKVAAKDNVTINAIAPGLVDTEMTQDPNFHYSLNEVPMGRVGDPSEIADVALFLASDLSRYVTGQCINVNGGMYMG